MAAQTSLSREWRLGLAGLLGIHLEIRSANWERVQLAFGLMPALAAAIAVRVYGVVRFPFLHDEPRLAEGLRAIMGSGPSAPVVGTWPASLLFGGPLAGGMQNITPLWWWLDFAMLRLWRGNETLALRLPHLLIGLAGIILIWRLARAMLAPPVPAMITWVAAVDDIYLWTSAKAQFPDVIFLPLGAIIAHALIVGRGRWKPVLTASAAWVVAAGYLLIKGMALGLSALTVGAVQSIALGLRERRLDIGLLLRRAIIVAAIGFPLAIWLVGAQRYIATNYQVRVGDLGYYHSLIDIVYDLTLGFGVNVKRDFVGPSRLALLYYTHADAWPTTTFITLFVMASLVAAVVELISGVRELSGRWHLALYVVVSIVFGLAPLLLKGAIGERYHLLYFAAALLAVGLTLEQLWLARRREWGLFLLGLGVYVGAMLSWADWLAGVWRPGAPMLVASLAGLLFGAGYWFARSVSLRRAIVLGVVACGVALSLVRGPLDWGLTAPYSPEPFNGVLQPLEQRYHP